jgi:secondary thiamine-phosphate synthase enzyme
MGEAQAMPPLVEKRTELTFKVDGPAILDITSEVLTWLRSFGALDGLLTVFLRHASGSLTIGEAGDQKGRMDVIDVLGRLASGDRTYRVGIDGIGDIPAHIGSMLNSVSLSIPVFGKAMALGSWQGISVIEHRHRDTPRIVALHFVGFHS